MRLGRGRWHSCSIPYRTSKEDKSTSLVQCLQKERVLPQLGLITSIYWMRSNNILPPADSKQMSFSETLRTAINPKTSINAYTTVYGNHSLETESSKRIE